MVHPTTLHKTLHFIGIIQPIQESTVISPIHATVDSIHYSWGQTVKRNAVIFTLNSTALQKHYNDTVTEYLKAKDSYTVARAKFIGTEHLWQSGLLSKNNYLSEKSMLNTERVTLMQSTRKVSELLEKMGQGSHADDELAGLSFSEFDKVHLALMSKHNLIQLKSPSRGILLHPPQAENDNNHHLNIGTMVKTGQVLALIGDMRGIRVDVEIPETQISAIQPGMKASVHGVAFAKETLHGQVISINAQASNRNNSSVPSFNAIIEVEHLTPGAQKHLKVGMSAGVTIAIHRNNQLMVPIKALTLKRHQAWVTLQQDATHTERRKVITGTVAGECVAILRGISPGDTLLYDDLHANS
jgi:multidrug efflux pump subunit AcrA (membrane-fusion protein)